MNFDQLKDHRQRFGLQDPQPDSTAEPAARANPRKQEWLFEIRRETIAASMIANAHKPNPSTCEKEHAGSRARSFTRLLAKG